ncbi:MAG: amidohydrolase family protein [Candidatus Acidiferrales bacterium]|jgi:hypothetical protein
MSQFWEKGIRLLCAMACLGMGALLLAKLASGQGGAAATTVITGGTLIDGTGTAPLKNSVIVIEGNKFKAVGKSNTVAVPAGAKTIDAAGRFIIPGLFDSHIHYRDYVPELFLAYGITSVIDMGNPEQYILAQREAINKGEVAGPRIFASGPSLMESEAPSTSPVAPVRNADDVRKTVRSLIAKGVDQITVNIAQDPDTFAIMSEEAHKAGLPISAYTMHPREEVTMGLDILEHSYSVSAGTKTDHNMLEQMRRERAASPYQKHPLDYMVEAEGADPFIQLLVQKGTYVIPSLVFEYKLIHDHVDEFKQDYLNLLHNPGLRYLPYDDYLVEVMNMTEGAIPRLSGPGFFGTLDRQGEEFRQYQAGYRRLQQFLVKLERAGGNILAGTDAPYRIPPGISLHHEMQLLVDAGLTPMQVLVDATRKPAAAMHKQKILGTIEAGKVADLVILRANPLDDIKNTRTIETVIKDGRVIDTTFHPSFTNPIPRPFSLHSEPEYSWAPVLQRLVPAMATEGDSDLSLTLQGAHFTTESGVSFDGQPVPTTFVSEQQLKAMIPAGLFQRAGIYPVAVSTPRPGGGSSKQIEFRVDLKTPRPAGEK